MMKRRDALKTLGGLAGAAALGRVLPGCAVDDDGPVGITTVVCLMMENRTYDHVFGARALEGLPGDGLVATMSNPDRLGRPVPVFAAGGGDAVCVADPPHGWETSRGQFNGGLNDGFVQVHQQVHDSDLLVDPMQYLTRAHQPVSWALADHFTTCDRWFASVMGPTWPNRMYWHTGTSQGISSNDIPADGFNWPSVYHRLLAKGVEYAYYFGDVPVLAVIEGLPGNADRMFRMDDFFAHAAAGTLPPVVYIDPAFSANDDHPPHHTMLGQQLIAAIYTALATSPQWKNTLLVITYDEHGGFFDHVPPPADAADEFAAQGFGQRGFRVPAMVVGPYVKQGAVVSTTFDHATPLKHLETMFQLDPLTARTSAAADLTDCLDLDRLARGEWAPPAEIPAVEVNESDITDACRYGGKAADDHPLLLLPRQFPERFKGFGMPDPRDTIYAIGDYLDRHGQGRIVRGR